MQQITLSPTTLPVGGYATLQQWYETILAATAATIDISGFIIAQTGGPKPNKNVGIWLKNRNDWWVWDPDAGEYIPKISKDFEIGDMLPTGRAVPDPDRWLVCDGREISRFDPYDKLFDAIGTAYGVGNNATTFNLPATGGRTLMGVGVTEGFTRHLRGEFGGLEKVGLQGSEVPVFNTDMADPPTTNVTKVTPKPNSFSAAGAPHENMMPFTVALFKIRYR